MQENRRANERRTVGQRGGHAELAGLAQEYGRWQIRDECDRHAEGQDEARQAAENVERVAAEAVVDVVDKREERVSADDPKRERSQRQLQCRLDEAAAQHRRNQERNGRRRPINGNRHARDDEYAQAADQIAEVVDGDLLHGDLYERRHGADQHAVELTAPHQPFHLTPDVAKADPAQRVNHQPQPVQECDLAQRPTAEVIEPGDQHPDEHEAGELVDEPHDYQHHEVEAVLHLPADVGGGEDERQGE
jgi:hypothetical protein